MSDLKLTTLPERDEMLRRLRSVQDGEPLVSRFYPIILAYAGREMAGIGVVTRLTMAIADYTRGMPSAVALALSMYLERYVTCLIDDEAALQEALTMIREI